LLGAFVSTLNGRLSTFGLADIRGALGMSFDEAAWITTSQTVAQMLIAPIAVWASTVIGPRRVLLAGATTFATASLLQPLSDGANTFLSLQFLSGLGSGCFMPLTIMVVLKGMPPKYWAIGIALYALNIEASLNISASVEGLYVEYLSWAWIFWQNVPLAIGLAACVHFGFPRQPVDRQAARRADWLGMASAAFGFSLIYAALDQGNRLDWLGSDLVVALLLSGGALVLYFFIRELTTREPWIDVRMLAGGFLPILLLLVCEVRFASLGTAFIVPQYLAVVRGFRPLETGSVLLWIAIPQLVAVPLAAYLLRRVDPRWVAGVGVAMIAVACWLTATHLTAQWATDDFLATQLLQALGQTLALSAAIFTGVLYLKPAAMATFGVTIQIARLLGGEIGFATIVTFVRVSEQVASNLIGSHVQMGTLDTLSRLQALGAGVASRSDSAGAASARAVAILSQSVRTQANLQACIDGFSLIAASSVVAFVLLLAFAPPPRGPASPTLGLGRLRWRKS